jgi:hypothetical protein
MFDTTATKMTASGKTGGSCQVSGPYKCSRHTEIVLFIVKGQTFPADPVDGAATGWTMVS